jgi:hypothetical protein
MPLPVAGFAQPPNIQRLGVVIVMRLYVAPASAPFTLMWIEQFPAFYGHLDRGPGIGLSFFAYPF